MSELHGDFLVLAVDIGTSSTRTALFDTKARRLPETSTAQNYSVVYGDDGRAELSPFELLRAVTRARDSTLHSYRSVAAAKRLPIRAIGGSALWHGLLGLDRRFRPLTPVFTWADSRAALDARRLREAFDERRVQQTTGCMLRASFWPAKLVWLGRTQPRLFRKVAYWVSPSDWIFQKLFGELRCSASMASGTGLYDASNQIWDEKLLEACGITVSTLPFVATRLEHVTSVIETVFCPIGDGAAGNLGSGADKPRVAAVNVGTSAALRIVHQRQASPKQKLAFGLFRYVVDDNRSITGGATSNAGNLRQWCLRELRIDDKPQALELALSRKTAATDSLTILPFWVEERAPTWPEGQRGIIDGLNQSTTAAEIARASATAVFYRLRQILDQLEQSLGRIYRIIVSGGIVKSRASVALLADAMGRDLEISGEPEASLRGAAVHALGELEVKMQTPPSGKIVKHDRALAARHRMRRERQIRLEQILRGR
jgi:gluconokinase